jgi:hypothetical protein
MSEPLRAFDELGPLDLVAVEFPGGRITGEGFGILLDLVDRGAVRILDLEFVAKGADGELGLIDLGDLETDAGLDLSAYAGASSGLLDQSDIDAVGASIESGSVAALLVYEELSLLPVLAAWQRSGARLVTEGHVSAEDLVLALDASEPA